MAAPPGLPYAESFPGALPGPLLARIARRGTRTFYLRARYVASALRHGNSRSRVRQARLFLSFVTF